MFLYHSYKHSFSRWNGQSFVYVVPGVGKSRRHRSGLLGGNIQKCLVVPFKTVFLQQESRCVDDLLFTLLGLTPFHIL